MTLTVYCYHTGRKLGDLTGEALADYLAFLATDPTGTGAARGVDYGYPGCTIYAL